MDQHKLEMQQDTHQKLARAHPWVHRFWEEEIELDQGIEGRLAVLREHFRKIRAEPPSKTTG